MIKESNGRGTGAGACFTHLINSIEDTHAHQRMCNLQHGFERGSDYNIIISLLIARAILV